MEYRRKRGDMIEVYKIFNKMVRIEPSEFFTPSQNSKKLFKNRFKEEVRKHAFSQRIISDWNSLTENIVTSESLDIFKKRLDKHWKSEHFRISTEP